MGAQWKVKHKEAASNAKGKIFGKLVKEITIAARNGADTATSAGLLGETVQYHRVTYEGFAPHQVPLIVECVTDNINRTVAEIRVAFRKGQLGASGSVSWDFNHVGMIEASPDSHDADPEMAAIEAGAQDFEPGEEEGTTLFLTEPADLDAVQKALPEQGFTVLSAKLGYQPKNPVSGLSDEHMAEVEAFLEGLDNHDDVQDMFVGLAG